MPNPSHRGPLSCLFFPALPALCASASDYLSQLFSVNQNELTTVSANQEKGERRENWKTGSVVDMEYGLGSPEFKLYCFYDTHKLK